MGIRRLAVFLDRDGVINEANVRRGLPYPPASIEDLRLVSEAPSALHDLSSAGFLLVVITNQPDVARGTQRREVVEEINRSLLSSLPLHDILVCYHSDGDCSCRKPKPGLLLEAARRHRIELSRSFMIGDRWRDIEAGHNAGCFPVWIDRGYQERGFVRPPAARVESLRQASDWILQFTRKGVSP